MELDFAGLKGRAARRTGAEPSFEGEFPTLLRMLQEADARQKLAAHRARPWRDVGRAYYREMAFNVVGRLR